MEFFLSAFGATWAKESECAQILGRVGGRGGRPGNLVLLVQGKDFDTGVRHA